MVICALGGFLASNPRAMGTDREGWCTHRRRVEYRQELQSDGKGLGKLGVVFLAWSLRKGMRMRKKLVGEAPPQGRRGDRGGAVCRRRSPASSGGAPARWSFNGESGGRGAPPWLC